MAATYAPAAHTAPITATVGGVNVEGLSPGRAFVAINDGLAPTTVFLPTTISADSYPTTMAPFTTGTGTVT